VNAAGKALLVVGLMAVLVALWLTRYRYDHAALFERPQGSFLLRTNRWTGTTEYYTARGWQKARTPAPTPVPTRSPVEETLEGLGVLQVTPTPRTVP
jgi:hypothetical protein